jgi:hypothetical protein
MFYLSEAEFPNQFSTIFTLAVFLPYRSPQEKRDAQTPGHIPRRHHGSVGMEFTGAGRSKVP